MRGEVDEKNGDNLKLRELERREGKCRDLGVRKRGAGVDKTLGRRGPVLGS